jgi:hypothetical protein
MKANLFLLIIFVTLAAADLSYAQTPTYELQATNFVRKSIDVPDDAIEYDIKMRQTNVPTRFEYAGGQFFFDFNKEVISGTMTMSIIGSDLPTNMQPRNPTVYTTTTPGQFRWAVNTFPGAGNGYMFPAIDTSVLIVKARLKCTNSMNILVPLSLNWRSAFPPNPFTKIFAYVDSVNTEITVPSSNSIDSSGLAPYPAIRIGLTVLFEGKYYPLFNQLSSRDTAVVYLRDATFPYTKRDSAKGVIDSLSFSRLFTFTNAPSGRYYIVVKHFQSIETWSRAGGDSLTANGSWHTYNFTSSPSQAYGDNMKLKGSKYCIYTGDINQSGFVDGSDAIRVHSDSQIFLTGRFLVTDLNGDNIVDGTDYLIVDNNAFNFIGTVRP